MKIMTLTTQYLGSFMLQFFALTIPSNGRDRWVRGGEGEDHVNTTTIASNVQY